ncbi:MAG: hypothetical protein ACI97A_000974 [Planctomycetota bacterium]|jgi:hypothetical protein
MNRFKLSLAVLIATCVPLFCQVQSGQTLKKNILTDHDFKFQLRGPKSAQVLDAKAAQQIVPDSQGGMVLESDIYSVVVIERAPGGDASTWSDTIVGQLGLENKVVESRTKVKFAGRDAVKTIVTGTTQDINVRFQHMIFMNSGFLYQVIAWGIASSTKKDGSTFLPTLNAFRLLAGKVGGRKSSFETPSMGGVGWQYKDKKFESAPLGIEVVAKAPWRVAVGDELKSMSPEAEVGILHDTAYLVVIGEQVVGVNQKEFSANLQSGLLLSQGTTSKPSREKMKVGGREVSFITYQTTAPAITFYHGVVFHGDTCLQIQAWYVTNLEKEAKGTLKAGLESIRFLDPEALLALSKKMAKAPYLDTRIGLNHVLSNGVFREFESGLTWSRPDGFWRISIGEEARVKNEKAVMWLEEPSRGIFGFSIVDSELGGLKGKGYHEVIVDEFAGTKRKTIETKVAGHPGFLTIIDMKGETPLIYYVYTASVGTSGVQLFFWGFPGNMKTAEESIQQALGGLEFHGKKMPKTERKGQQYTDHRLRFQLQLPSKSTEIEDSTPAPVRALGTILSCELSSDTNLTLIAMCAPEDSDDDWFDSFSSGSFDVLDDDPSEGKDVIAGVPCTWVHYDGGSHHAKIFTFSRNGTHYCLMFTGSAIEDIEKQKPCFKLL